MLASELRGPRDMGLQDAPMPTVEDEGVLLRLIHVGACGSDVKAYIAGRVSQGRPAIPGVTGHECVGEVVESRSAAFQVGDLVLALPPHSNGFAEYLAVPARACLPVPPGVTPLRAVRAQQLGTVIHALRPVAALLDRTVAIIGQGSAGLDFLRQVRGMGARTVVTLEPRGARREFSAELGADLVLHPSQPGALEQVREATGGGPDLVIDAAGGQAAIDLAYQLARPFGAVLHFGLADGATHLDHELALRKEVTTYRSIGAQAEPNLACFRLAMDRVRRGEVPTDALFSHHFPLQRLPEALDLAADPNGDALKIVIDVST